MQLLKAHLLVEQTFRELLDLLVLRPERLGGGGAPSLNAHAVICLVEAMTPASFPHDWAFVAAKRLNKARNSLAHKLDDNIHKTQCDEFIDFVKTSQPEFAIAMRDTWKVPKKSEFATCIGGLCSVLSHLKADVARAHSIVGEGSAPVA